MPVPRLLLASRSPRRARLLREAGYVFDQANPPFEDPPIPEARHGQDPAAKAVELATRKALSVPVEPGDGRVILACDTLCVGADGSLLGTPSTREEARTMIASFRDAVHEVVTGVALRPGRAGGGCTDCAVAFTFADTARVVFGRLSDEQIERYLDGEAWRGKAGGYNLFERQSDGWPIRVEGDPTTVVGLPMSKLAEHLARLDIHPTADAPTRRGGPSIRHSESTK